MWVIMATALPGYLPSVLRGDRLKKLAPARWATAWQTEVLPVRGAPYRSTALAQGSLQGGTLLSLEHPISPPRQPQALPVLSGSAGTMGRVHACCASSARQHSNASRLSACSKRSPGPRPTGKGCACEGELPTGGSRLGGPPCMPAALPGPPISYDEQLADPGMHLADVTFERSLPGSLETTR